MQERVKGTGRRQWAPKERDSMKKEPSLFFLPKGVSWASGQRTIPIALLGGCVWLCPWQELSVLCALCLCTPLCPGGCPNAMEK